MEALEEPPLHNSTIDGVKVNVVSDETDLSVEASVEADVCQKSNGVADLVDAGQSETVVSETVPLEDFTSVPDSISNVKEIKNTEILIDNPAIALSELDTELSTTADIVKSEAVEKETGIKEPTIIVVDTNNVSIDAEKNIALDETHLQNTTIEVDSIVEVCNEKVTFETEILVETNDNEINENASKVLDTTHNILNELGQSIELSEALRSSNVTDNVKNNNCEVRQEMFNKEELLDILEGNDEEQSRNIVSENFHSGSKMLEAQLALRQLSRLKSSKSRKPRRLERLPRRKKNEKKYLQDNKARTSEEVPGEETTQSFTEIVMEKSIEIQSDKKNIKDHSAHNTTAVPVEESIVNVLVKDWDDEEPLEGEKSIKFSEKSEGLLKTSEQLIEAQDSAVKQEKPLNRSSIDSTMSDGQSPIVSITSDETQPQKRLGRVIKKKVIFDPDNPDTFTKSKSIKNREPQIEKEQPPSKKVKAEQICQRPKSKSPISKLQWKKPPPKNSRRLTEIDKLLMDEGAVNMICQLTPEAPKGKKNTKSKAEFIKKIQSSTPDSKEMKFRERKKESKSEDGEAKKILGVKQRLSLSSSVKSPSVCEDFEAHSADDSVIIRRHSSSSYSSSCMSPRRLSDVDVSVGQNSARTSQPDDAKNQANVEIGNDGVTSAVFMGVNTDIEVNEIINKDDCLSIKEKLNSKLSLALNKRKRDSTKAEKPSKQKKVTKIDEISISNVEAEFKHLIVNLNQTLAEICIRKSGSMYDIEIIKELESAFVYVESRKDVSVTLLTSECGALCSGIDLRPMLSSNGNWKSYAYDIAESVRSLLCSVDCHSKLVCCGVEGRCSGVGAALAVLSDVTLAGELASFVLGEQLVAPLQPGAAALSVAARPLTHSLLNDLVVLGRRVSASEALQGGLVSRILWPDRFAEQARAVARDIAAQPTQNIMLKKRLLSLKKAGSKSTFLSCLEKERDLFVEYWTSAEGQELLRASLEESNKV